MSTVLTPPGALAGGMTRLVLADDFENYDQFDLSAEGKPGYTWYTDRPFWYGNDPLVKDIDFRVENSVLRLAPRKCNCSVGLLTYSKKGKTGYTMHYGYAEARMKFRVHDLLLDSRDDPEHGRNGWPAFWTMSLRDTMGELWEESGEIDVMEGFLRDRFDGNGGVIYVGTAHAKRHLAEYDTEKKRFFNVHHNGVNSTGYQDNFVFIDEDWHTYGMLWEPGRIAWYFDDVEMHSLRYYDDKLPEYFYRNDPTPVPWENPEDVYHRAWPGAYSIMDQEQMVVFLGAHRTWPVDYDWVRIWEK